MSRAFAGCGGASRHRKRPGLATSSRALPASDGQDSVACTHGSFLLPAGPDNTPAPIRRSSGCNRPTDAPHVANACCKCAAFSPGESARFGNSPGQCRPGIARACAVVEARAVFAQFAQQARGQLCARAGQRTEQFMVGMALEAVRRWRRGSRPVAAPKFAAFWPSSPPADFWRG